MKSWLLVFIALLSWSIAFAQDIEDVAFQFFTPDPTHFMITRDIPIEDLTAAAPRGFQVRFFVLKREIDIIDTKDNRHGYPMNARVLLRYAIERADELFQSQEANEFTELLGEDAMKPYRLGLWLHIFIKNAEIEKRIASQEKESRHVVDSYIASNTERIGARLKEIMEPFDDKTLVSMVCIVTGNESISKGLVHAIDSLRGNNNLNDIYLANASVLVPYVRLRYSLKFFTAEDETALETAEYFLGEWEYLLKSKEDGKPETMVFLLCEDIMFRLEDMILPLLSEESSRLFPNDMGANIVDNARVETPVHRFRRELRRINADFARAQYSSLRAAESRLIPLLWLYASDYSHIAQGYYILNVLDEE